MCGIVASVGGGATPERVATMSARLAHRGPDGAGAWHADGVALAHRRLSILDLSPAGAQPMTSHDGRYHMVFNGEIYNFVELARTLPDVAWRSASDSEVLLELFARRGAACLVDLVGMFALAVWDSVERRLFCARDHVGIKPLYVARTGDAWSVASEIGALLGGGTVAAPDEAVIFDFLARDFYEHGDDTFFRGVRKLPPGHWMWLDAQGPRPPVRFWNLADASARVTLASDPRGRGEQLVTAMADSVRLALRADVPVGITLSGGLDSATLLALVDRVHPDASAIATFSFDFEDPEYSERPWVEAMARHTGHPTAFRTVTPADFVAQLAPGVAQQQEPHAGAPITAYSLCFEMLRAAGVIVAMDGSGIDEGLAGYARFRPARWADLATAGDTATLAAELAAAGATDDAVTRAQMAAAASDHGDVGIAQDLSASVQPSTVTAALGRHARPVAFERPFRDALRNLMFRELRYTKLPRALRFRDRLSMAHGTELRPPFLDPRLLAFMFALPAEDHIHRGQTKALLRDAATRLLPDAVRLASKRSVQTPQREWFRGPLAAWVRARIDRPAFWDRGWVDRTRALAALDRYQAGEGSNSFFLWQWIVLGEWADAFLS